MIGSGFQTCFKAFPFPPPQTDSKAFAAAHLAVFQVWGIQEQHCLLTVDSEESGIRGGITACAYSSAAKSLYVAADGMALLSLKRRSVHERTLSCSLYISEKISLLIYFRFDVIIFTTARESSDFHRDLFK